MNRMLLRYLLVIGITVVGYAGVVANETELEKISRIKSFVKASFIQQRHLKILKKPLNIKGELLFQADKGIVWKTNEPYQLTLLINEQGSRKLGDKGETVSNVSAPSPIFHELAASLVAIINQDWQRLKSVFAIEVMTGSDGVYTVVMYPREQPLQRLFQRIRVEGTDTVEQIKIIDGGGDVTDIRFFNKVLSKKDLRQEDLLMLNRL